MTTFSTEVFTWVKEEKQFVCKASDLGIKAGENPVRPDAQPGLQLESSRTGVIVTYYLWSVKEEEGDLLWWEFKPTRESVRRTPAAQGTTVRIYND